MFLITGATGQLGGSIIQYLLTKVPANQIVALVRNGMKAAKLKEAGIIVRVGDYHNPASLTGVFTGVKKAVLVSSNDFNNRLGQHINVIDAAAAAGVDHLVYTGASLRDVNTSVLRQYMIDHFQTEDHLKESGVHYTFMRHNLYAEMIPLYTGPQVLEKGIVFPGGDGQIPFALRDEMGEANAGILLGEGHENKTYNVAGDTCYSFQDIADILSELAGKKISYTQPDDNTYLGLLLAAGLPEHMAKVALSFATAMRNGDFNVPGNDLKDLLGRKPAGLKTYLKQAYFGA